MCVCFLLFFFRSDDEVLIRGMEAFEGVGRVPLGAGVESTNYRASAYPRALRGSRYGCLAFFRVEPVRNASLFASERSAFISKAAEKKYIEVAREFQEMQ